MLNHNSRPSWASEICKEVTRDANWRAQKAKDEESKNVVCKSCGYACDGMKSSLRAVLSELADGLTDAFLIWINGAPYLSYLLEGIAYKKKLPKNKMYSMQKKFIKELLVEHIPCWADKIFSGLVIAATKIAETVAAVIEAPFVIADAVKTTVRDVTFAVGRGVGSMAWHWWKVTKDVYNVLFKDVPEVTPDSMPGYKERRQEIIDDEDKDRKFADLLKLTDEANSYAVNKYQEDKDRQRKVRAVVGGGAIGTGVGCLIAAGPIGWGILGVGAVTGGVIGIVKKIRD